MEVTLENNNEYPFRKGDMFALIWNNLYQPTDPSLVENITHTRNVKKGKGQDGRPMWEEEEYQLSYYKWSACWRELVKKYPNSTYSFKEFDRDGKIYDVMYYADQSASVHCTVTVNGISREMWLPVMDYKNKSIPNPSSRDINDAKMRCLVKCVSMFGLGFDLYDGTYNGGKNGLQK